MYPSVLFVAGFTALIALASPVSSSYTVVNITQGTVLGTSSVHRDNVTVFRGIPYGGPTSGSQRWKAPTAPANWTGVYNATTWGPQCAAPVGQSSLFTSSDTDISEDCLNLNIWKPAMSKKGDNLPVYVFIFGGRFEVGSGEVTTYEASGLAIQGVIAVNINYRLGPFGWLAHPDLSAESGHNSSGNYGLLDQIAAIKWVHENIDAFGGDPDKITIGGQSAGSASALDMMYSPLTNNLGISGIIAESGARGTHDPMTGSAATSHRNKTAAEAQGVGFLTTLNVTSISGLREVPLDTLLEYDSLDDTIFEGTPFINNSVFMEPPEWRPVIDGYVLSHTYGEALRLDSHLDVPILTGNNKDESGASAIPDFTVETYEEQFGTMFGNLTDEFFTLFPCNNDTQAGESANTFYHELSLVGTWDWARNWYAGGAKSKVYTYYWTHAPGDSGSAGHGSELYFVFNNIPYGDSTNITFYAADYAIESKMVQYWANFIKTGNPSGGTLANFPARGENTTTMYLGDSWGIGPISNTTSHIAFFEKWFSYQQEW